MSRRTAGLGALVLVVGVALLGACADDDGAATRNNGSVVVIGPPPPGGGGSVSAVGTGCTTRGATTKQAGATIEVGLDEFTITAPASIAAGVARFVVKNFGSLKHELVIVRAASIDELPKANGLVDEQALASQNSKVMRIAAFEANTICTGTFELAAGSYVLFGNQRGPESAGGKSEFDLGMTARIVVR